MRTYFLSLIVVVSFFSSCKTDFEINAPYEITPVVYGVIDQSLDTQFIKINKAFLGSGNNINYAAINDCTLFDSVLAVLEAYDYSGVLVDVDTLKEKMVVGMDPGIFYNDSQKVYYSTIPNRSEDYSGNYEFHLKVQAIPNVKWLDTDSVLDTLATHKLLSFGAITTLIEDNYVANPFNEYNNNDLFDGNWYYGMITNGVSFADNNLSTPLDDDFEIEWDETENGERYELVLRFHYTEQMTDLSSESKYMDWNLGTKKTKDALSDGFVKTVDGIRFYEMVSSNLENYNLESQVLKRIFPEKPIEFILTVGNDILDTYMEVNEPVTGIVTERPIYTNINNDDGDAAGVFASKYQCSRRVRMSDGSILELCAGSITNQYKFCYDVPQSLQIINGIDVGCN